LKQPSLYSRTDDIKENKGGRGVLRLILIIFLSIGLVYLVFFSGVFSVDSIEYSPTEFVDRGELDKIVNENKIPLIEDNIFTFGIFGFSSRVEKVTGITRVHVKRLSQHSIRLEIEEKAPLLVWNTLERKYLVDDTGVAWANYDNKYAALPMVSDTKNIPIKAGDKVLPQGFINFFSDMKADFVEDTGVKPIKYEVLDIVSDLKVSTDAGWYVYFDTSRTAKNELISLKRVLSEAKANGSRLEYVDLRINNRIFYK
jgi:hypothetical protein